MSNEIFLLLVSLEICGCKSRTGYFAETKVAHYSLKGKSQFVMLHFSCLSTTLFEERQRSEVGLMMRNYIWIYLAAWQLPHCLIPKKVKSIAGHCNK